MIVKATDTKRVYDVSVRYRKYNGEVSEDCSDAISAFDWAEEHDGYVSCTEKDLCEEIGMINIEIAQCNSGDYSGNYGDYFDEYDWFVDVKLLCRR